MIFRGKRFRIFYISRNCFFLLRFSSAFYQRLVEQVQNLPVDAAKFVGSPLFKRFHLLFVNAKHEGFIFILFCQFTFFY